MIWGDEEYTTAKSIQDLAPSTLDTMSAAFGETLADNVGNKLYYNLKKSVLNDQGPYLPKEEIIKKASEKGVQLKDLPDEGLSEGAANLLIDRQYESKKRKEILSSSDTSMVLTGASSLAAGILDPVNLAADYFVSAGLGAAFRTAKFINSARGLSKLGRRGVIGAAEGGIAAAALEPGSYYLSQELQDDYTAIDSLQNIAFGTVIGGGLHMGAGSLSDAYKGLKARRSQELDLPIDDIRVSESITVNDIVAEQTPNNPISEQLAKSSPEARQAYMKTSVAQLLEDRPVDIGPIRDAEVYDSLKKLDNLEVEIKRAAKSGNADYVAKLELDRSRLKDVIADSDTGIIRDTPAFEGSAELAPEVVGKKNIADLYKKNDGTVDVELAKKSTVDRVKSYTESGDSVLLRMGDKSIDIVGIEGKKLTDAEGKTHSIDEIIDGEKELLFSPQEASFAGRSPELIAQKTSVNPRQRSMDDLRKTFKESSTNPNSKYINDNVEAELQTESQNMPDYEEINALQSEIEFDIEKYKESAELAGQKLDESLLALDDINKLDEDSNFMKRMVGCLFTRGV
jgi:hypothetical protein